MINQKLTTKRFTAYVLDAVLVYFFIVLVSNIRFINPTYNKLLEVTETYNETVEAYENDKITDDEYFEMNKQYIYDATKYNVSTNIVFVLVILAYFGVFQKFNNGQTLGKKIMKIKVVGVNDKDVNLPKYLLRVLPMYYILMGSVIPFLLSSILVFIMGASSFSITYSIMVYTFVAIGLISFVMSYVRKDHRGLHDLLAGTKVVSAE